MVLKNKKNIELITEEEEEVSVPFESPGIRVTKHRNYSIEGIVKNCEMIYDVHGQYTIFEINTLKNRLEIQGYINLRKGDCVRAFLERPFKKDEAIISHYVNGRTFGITGLIVFNKKGEIESSYRIANSKICLKKNK